MIRPAPPEVDRRMPMPSAVALARLAALAPKAPCRVRRLVGRPGRPGHAARRRMPRGLMLADLG